MLPCYLLPAFFFYSSLPPAPAERHPAQAGLTSPDLLSLYRPLEKEQIEMGHFPPTSFSAFSLSLSLLLYLFFRKDIYLYISRAHDILIRMATVTRQHFRSTACRDTCKIKAGNR